MLKYLLPLILIASIECAAQRIALLSGSFGYIKMNNSGSVGSGFVLNKKNQVVTCAHVLDTTKEIFYVAQGIETQKMVKHKMRVIRLIPEYDLALLEAQEDLTKLPLIAETNFDFTPGQHLFYLGLDINRSTPDSTVIGVSNAFAIGVGKEFEGSNTLNFVEFEGTGLPGYSGGPVINDQGKVIAVLRECWHRQGYKGGPIEIINRAVSLNPLLKAK